MRSLGDVVRPRRFSAQCVSADSGSPCGRRRPGKCDCELTEERNTKECDSAQPKWGGGSQAGVGSGRWTTTEATGKLEPQCTHGCQTEATGSY